MKGPLGGTTTAQGGTGLVGIGSDAFAQFANLTIWKTGQLIDSGALSISGDVTGSGLLEIGDSGTVKLSGGAGASLDVEFSGAGALTPYEPQRFAATIQQMADGASIKVAGFAGAHETFVENAAQTRGTVSLTGAGALSTYDSLHFAGNFTASEFQWNTTTSTLTFHS